MMSAYRAILRKTPDSLVVIDHWLRDYGHCLISSRGGQGTSLQITGLATIDPHSQKVHTKLYKNPQVLCQ